VRSESGSAPLNRGGRLAPREFHTALASSEVELRESGMSSGHLLTTDSSLLTFSVTVQTS
jgi:hypothetical protein